MTPNELIRLLQAFDQWGDEAEVIAHDPDANTLHNIDYVSDSFLASDGSVTLQLGPAL